MSRHFQFPDVCTRCAKARPTEHWTVKGPSKVVRGPAATVTTTPYVKVPVCPGCWRSMMGSYALIWMFGLMVAGLTFFWFNGGLGLQDRSAVTLAAVVSFFAMLAGVAVAEWAMKSEITVGKLYPERGAILFHNGDYQAIFDQFN